MSEVGDLFRAMAARIERNPENEFAGALLIVPPADQNGARETIEHLAVATKPDMAAFWGTASAKIEIAKAIFDQQQLDRSRGGAGGYMR